jgi:hypothetical protein
MPSRASSRPASPRTKPVIVTFKLIRDEMGTAPPTWQGRGHEIAERLIRRGYIEGEPRHGFYLGPLAPTSSVKPHCGYVRHGWAALYDGRVCDPLRWMLEAVTPYLFLDRDVLGRYDTNGERSRAKYAVHPPAFKPDAILLSPCSCAGSCCRARRRSRWNRPGTWPTWTSAAWASGPSTCICGCCGRVTAS